MKTILLKLCLLSSVVLYADGEPRMKLLVSDMLGKQDIQTCSMLSEQLETMMSKAKLQVSENDVTSWNSRTGILTLNSTKFPKKQFTHRFQDHCFYLHIDGKLLTSGAVLSSLSARLSKDPTIIVFYGKKDIEMKLASGNSADAKPIYADELNNILGK